MKRSFLTFVRIVAYLVILAAATVPMRCSTKNADPSSDQMYREIYVNQFKLTYFRMLLKKSYNNSKAVQEILIQDHSGFTEPVLSLDDRKMIDSLTTLDNFNLKADSASSIGRVAEGAEGKHPLQYILMRFERSWLDSLANKRYEKLDPSPF